MTMPKLLYLISEDWFFCSHFIERAIAAKQAGYEVIVVARETGHGAIIRNAGLRLIPLKVKRQGINPFSELRTLLDIWRIYRKERPDLLHHIAFKPILYGSFVARLMGLSHVINAPVGMGYIFTSNGRLAQLLRPFVLLAMHWLINPPRSKVVFENIDDLTSFVADGLVQSSDAVLIRGAGVNINQFRPQPEPEGSPVVVLMARMLWDKGVGEFVEAARQLRSEGITARFILVGAPDLGNPAAIPNEQLQAWHADGVIEWLGHQTDIPTVLASSHIVCLPSYREGLPKSLIEALAAGKPVVTTDVPGCREVVHNGDNGILVPPRNVHALVTALSQILSNPKLRAQFGSRGRVRAETEFASHLIIKLTLSLYEELLSKQIRLQSHG